MSGFTDMMIDDGFTDPEDYLDHLCNEAASDNYPDYHDNRYEYSDDYEEDEEFFGDEQY